MIVDNQYIYEGIRNLVEEINLNEKIDFFYSYHNAAFRKRYCNDDIFCPVSLKKCTEDFWKQYNVFFSFHCKQLFPDALVKNHRCINIHPGFNPYNRGWFPQVFSILNQQPIGVTIHEMDSEIDHGPIIYQEEVLIESYDTSYDVYQKILQKEMEMLRRNLYSLVKGEYNAVSVKAIGNINYKEDFNRLCKLKLDQVGTLGEHINLLRALTFEGYKNAYFEEDNKKIYTSIKFEIEENQMRN